MKDLIIAAEAALVQMKDFHLDDGRCPGIEHCPTAAAIANLEAEIAKAKLRSCERAIASETPQQRANASEAADSDAHVMGRFNEHGVDPEFQAVAPFKVQDVGNPHIAAQILDAAAAIEVRPMFMPGRRLCVQCDAVLPSTTHAAVTRCERCMA